MRTRRHIFSLGALTIAGLVGTTVLAAGAGSATRGTPAIASQGRGGQNRVTRNLVGTYQLDSSQSDDARRAADQATSTMPPGQRDRAYQGLINRLSAPQELSIDRNGPQVTIASSTGPETSFVANGVSHSETGPGGRQITTRAEVRGEQLVVSTTGNRGTDFTVTFEPLQNGDGLRVTRTLYTEGNNRPVSVQAYYRRTTDQPQWNLYQPDPGPEPGGADFYVPDGTAIIATLDRPISTRDAREGDTFTMTVDRPAQFAGAQLDGAVTRVNDLRRSGRQADLVLSFRDIRPRGGQQSGFYGVLQSARLPNGAVVRIDTENVSQNYDQGGQAVQRGAVGAAVGAIIGAIAGGGKGAAIGAAIGGAGGAGTVLIDGQDQLDLPAGTQLTIIAHSPRR
jgi:hypothetical protein